jgi:hypothetical protein
VQYTLGRAVFEVPDSLRDSSSYVYGTKDEAWVLRVTPNPEASGAQDAVDQAKAGVDELLEPDMIYTKPMQVPDGAGGTAPGYEGEFKDPIGGSLRRYGLVGLAKGKTKATYFLLGPRAEVLPELKRIVAGTTFLAGAFDPAFKAAAGRTRYQADGLSFEVPAAWSYPTSLLFVDDDALDVTLRVTLDVPAVAAGKVSAADELPAAGDERVRTIAETVTPDHPAPPSWTGEWTLELTAQRGGTANVRRMVLRKACLILSSRPDVTVLGTALESNVARLSTAWDNLLKTFRERTP